MKSDIGCKVANGAHLHVALRRSLLVPGCAYAITRESLSRGLRESQRACTQCLIRTSAVLKWRCESEMAYDIKQYNGALMLELNALFVSRVLAKMKFPDLISQISKIDEVAQLAAGPTLQQILSLRNWLIGASIVEFEQAGEDRAQYGQRLMHTLAQALGKVGCQGLSASNRKNFRQLALAYPGLNAINFGRRLSLPIESDRVVGIRQPSGEFASDPENRRTSADSVCSPFPSLARRSAEEGLPWRDAPWLARLFTTKNEPGLNRPGSALSSPIRRDRRQAGMSCHGGNSCSDRSSHRACFPDS